MWLLRNDHCDRLGPVSTELLLRGIETGRVPADTEACLEGDGRWQPIGAIDAFALAFARSAPGPEVEGADLERAPRTERLPAPALEELCISQGELRPGFSVSSRVRLTRLLGSGSVASVWLGRDEPLERDVAVKVLAPELVRSHPHLATRFALEARAAARIRSPHVVEIHDYGTLDGGIPFLVLELLEGETLAAYLARRRPSLAEAVDIVVQTAKGLLAAHRRGVVHRDIKPSNLFLAEQGDEQIVKVIDFGLAKHPGQDLQLTRTGWIVGTPHYMSPEQILSAKSTDGSADLWALAVVTYEMLTGLRPFRGETPGAVMMAIAGFRWQRPSEHGADARLDAWFARAFHPEIDRRFPSAKSMAAALLDRSVACSSVPGAARSREAAPTDAAGHLRDPGLPPTVELAPGAAQIEDAFPSRDRGDGGEAEEGDRGEGDERDGAGSDAVEEVAFDLPMTRLPRLPPAAWWLGGALLVVVIGWLVAKGGDEADSDPVSIPMSSERPNVGNSPGLVVESDLTAAPRLHPSAAGVSGDPAEGTDSGSKPPPRAARVPTAVSDPTRDRSPEADADLYDVAAPSPPPADPPPTQSSPYGDWDDLPRAPPVPAARVAQPPSDLYE
jgi:serine/threonine-protein kinase